ncbi:MAG: glycerophosphodiester phosphodiesterase family protein [Candidatus Omnitrophica bacterium]|nr:glycerophosphodiester phosphodiesterase family protein [Candidatus Omnitrophota bacterium]MDD5670158.1 glycerophosphodiester phosphodiesterase family protein [Candidatus Omnitrophota bacterium]
MDIIAHRGANREFPENTLVAFERALEIGVDGLETDLLLTRDGQIVVRHDDWVKTRDDWHYIRELASGEIQQIDLGKGQRIPDLSLFFERFYGRIPLVFDLKCDGLAPLLAAYLKNHRADHSDKIHVTSFLQTEMMEFGKLCPGIRRSIIYSALPVHCERWFKETGVDEVSLYRGYLKESTVRCLRDQNIRVRVYSVNVLREACAFAAWGVNAIYTDDPAVMQSLRLK